MKNLSEKLKSEILAYAKKHQPEFYWDYRCELNEGQISTILSNKENLVEGMCEVEDEIIENNWEYEFSLKDEAIKELMDYFESDITDELATEREDWEEDFKEWIDEYVYVDYNFNDLIKKTSDQVFFIDTGLSFTGYGQSHAEYRLDRINIKKFFQITDSRFDDIIDMMLLQASYGGNLVVYFTLGIDELLDNASKANMVEFSNAHIAIINTHNGSGDDCRLMKHKFTLPFNVKNLFYERSVHYNYSFEVCGMTRDWCSGTGVNFFSVENAPETTVSHLNTDMEQQANYEKIFKQGKCSLGDNDIRRHRKVIYVNDFPCGNVCQACGQFWVD